MVAEHEERILRDRHLCHGTSVAIVGRHIGFIEQPAVHINVPFIDSHFVSGNSDYALDVALGGIWWIVEDHNVSSTDGLDPVNEFVDENSFLVFEAGPHADALNFHRLIKEENDKGRKRERNKQIA